MAAGSILIIEDETRLRDNLQILLSRAGYTVTTAVDGRDGIECLRHASFDVVLTDLTMREVDGFKAMEYMALRKPVVAFDLKETRFSCGDAALYAVPNSISDLVDKILRLVGDSKLREELGRWGYDRVNNVLAWNHSVPSLLRAYESALD